MWEILLVILGLLILFFVILVAAALIGDLFNRWSSLPWLLSLVISLLSYFFWIPKIWVSALVWFFALGILLKIASFARVKSPSGRTEVQCSNCKSYWLEETFKKDGWVGYKCKKCGQSGAVFFE